MVEHKFFNGNKYYLNQSRWKRTTYPQIKLSYDVWDFFHPEDTVKEGEDIHHDNGDPSDDRIENLQKMTHSEHLSLHKSGINHHFWKGGIKYKQLYLGGETIETNCSYIIFQNINSLGEIQASHFGLKIFDSEEIDEKINLG